MTNATQRHTVVTVLLAFTALWCIRPAQAVAELAPLLAQARPGQAVTLPAGHFRGGVVLPTGVSLRGAGYGLTVIDAAGCDTGLSIAAGQDIRVADLTVAGARVSDLTVQGARVNGIAVTHGARVTLSGVRVTGSMMGVNLDDVAQPRLENVISDHNRFGIVMNHCQHGVIVNCTVADCAETGVLLPTGTGTVIFNTVVANVSTGVNLGASTAARLDHNLYQCQNVGIMVGQIGRPLLLGWQSLSGQDAHSVQLPVTFRDAADGDYTPTTLLPWALDRLTTAGWGSTRFAGSDAPATDIRGTRRHGLPTLGACAGQAIAPRPADGRFTVTRGDGVTSAGVFTRDGKLLAYLFQNQPLRKGTYPYWLPTRDYAGRAIPAGAYEVRLVESRLRWQYLGHIADNGEDPSSYGTNVTAAHNPVSAAFLPGGNLLMGEDESEDHTNLRCYAETDRTVRWMMAGAYHMRGVTMGDDGYAYTLRTLDGQSARLTRLDPATGKLISWGGMGNEHAKLILGDGTGLAVLGGKLYTVAAGKLVTVDLTAVARNPQTTGVADTLPLEAPSCPTADASTHCVWVISSGRLVALTADGTVRATVSPVAEPASIAAANGLLAIASRATGKIHLFDAHDPAQLRLVRTVGSGDGPFGPYTLTRFLFQNAPGWAFTQASVALSPTGALAVIDWGRLIYLDAAGTPRWYTIGVFGNQLKPSFATGNRRLWDTMGDRSFRLDERSGQWAPEACWDLSAVPLHEREGQVVFRGDFTDHGQTFGVFCGHYASLTVVRFDGYRAVPVLTIVADPAHPGQLVTRKDTNHDGHIDAADGGEVLLGPDGKPLTALFERFEYLQANGDILFPHGSGVVMQWRRAGLDADGVPVYRGQDRTLLMRLDAKNFVDPYDGQPGGAVWVQAATRQPSGGYTVQAWFRGSGGTGANNGAGTDLVGLDAQGKLRWMNQLAPLHGIAGMGTANGVTVTSKFDSGEYLAFDEDGLGLGGFTEPAQLHYVGYWIDHPNLFMYRGLDGHGYVTYGDNFDGRHPWYRLLDEEQCRRQRFPCTVNALRAAALVALPVPSPPTELAPPHPHVALTHLTAPLAIDGTLEKWRTAGVPPQIILPPRDGKITKASAAIRLAYEGQNLYVQVFEFDNLPTFHFGLQCPVWQDCVEMGINGGGTDGAGGFQFLAFRGPDGKSYVTRYRFFAKLGFRVLEAEHAPCVVTVLPDARQVPERAALEALWGADLSTSKVIVTEFKLPFDARTYTGAEGDIPALGPGKSFWIGFFVDGSEFSGEELQHLMQWPPTFGFFSPKESGALAVCD